MPIYYAYFCSKIDNVSNICYIPPTYTIPLNIKHSQTTVSVYDGTVDMFYYNPFHGKNKLLAIQYI